MKAIVYEGIKSIKVKEVKDPSIEKPDDIVIKVTSSSICGSDLHLMHGMMPSMPKGFVIGHEAMGIVEDAGKEVYKVKKGDRVVIPFPISCGHCWYCEHELWSQCDHSNPNGEIGAIYGGGKLFGEYAGGQAEYLRVPYGNIGPVIIPEELSDEQVLFLSDILPTSYWGVTSGGVRPGDTVAVLGCGPVGLLTIKWAAYFGARRIIAVDHVEYRLKHAMTYGAEVINFKKQENTGEYIKEITHGGADVVIDCVGMGGIMTTFEFLETAMKLQGGSKSAIEIATQAVRKGGTVFLLGDYGARYHNFPLGDFFARNITLKMGQCPADSFVQPILELIHRGKFDATDIITHTLPLNQGEHAYDLFDKKKESCIKVILKP